jgi:ATP-dependent Clp protease protease subunit
MIKVYNEAGALTIDVNGAIGGESGFTLSKFDEVVKDTPEDVTVRLRLKTDGGNVFEAFAIHDRLRTIPNRTEVDMIGATASAGTIIAAGADYRRITKNSRHLVHFTQVEARGDKSKLSQVFNQLEEFDKQLVEIYMGFITKTQEELMALMSAEIWQSAEEAKAWGFVDEIIEEKKNSINNQIFDNMADPKIKVTNMTEEEKETMDALKAEIDTLKAALAEKDEELSALKAKAEVKEEEEIEAEVTALITSGKFKAEAKDSLKVLAKTNREAFNNVIGNVQAVAPVAPLASVPNRTAPTALKNVDEAWAKFKAGEITAAEYKNFVNNK